MKRFLIPGRIRNSMVGRELAFARAHGPVAPVLVLSIWPIVALMIVFAALIAGAVTQSLNEAVAFAVGATALPSVFIGLWIYFSLSRSVWVFHSRGRSEFRGKRSLWHYAESEKLMDHGRGQLVVLWSDNWQITNKDRCSCEPEETGELPHENALLCLPAVQGDFLNGPGEVAAELYQDVDPWELRHINRKQRSALNRNRAVQYGGGVTLALVLWLFVILF